METLHGKRHFERFLLNISAISTPISMPFFPVTVSHGAAGAKTCIQCAKKTQSREANVTPHRHVFDILHCDSTYTYVCMNCTVHLYGTYKVLCYIGIKSVRVTGSSHGGTRHVCSWQESQYHQWALSPTHVAQCPLVWLSSSSSRQ